MNENKIITKLVIGDRLSFLKTYLEVWIVDTIDTNGNMPVELDMAKYIHSEVCKLENKFQ